MKRLLLSLSCLSLFVLSCQKEVEKKVVAEAPSSETACGPDDSQDLDVIRARWACHQLQLMDSAARYYADQSSDPSRLGDQRLEKAFTEYFNEPRPVLTKEMLDRFADSLLVVLAAFFSSPEELYSSLKLIQSYPLAPEMIRDLDDFELSFMAQAIFVEGMRRNPGFDAYGRDFKSWAELADQAKDFFRPLKLVDPAVDCTNLGALTDPELQRDCALKNRCESGGPFETTDLERKCDLHNMCKGIDQASPSQDKMSCYIAAVNHVHQVNNPGQDLPLYPYQDSMVLDETYQADNSMGHEAFKKREDIIKTILEGQEKYRITVFVWAFRDDYTGHRYGELFNQLADKGHEVYVMVDGPISETVHRGAIEAQFLNREPASKVHFIQWKMPELPGYGMHRKVITFRSLEATPSQKPQALVGGINYGNSYSHLVGEGQFNPDESDRWRDTDLWLDGDAVIQMEKVFLQAWNEFQDRSEESQHLKIPAENIPAPPQQIGLEDITSQSKAASLIDYDPNHYTKFSNLKDINGHTATLKEPSGLDPILASTLALIHATRKGSTIEISNAYMMVTLTPLIDALTAAIRRGVVVHVHTNSLSSIDVKPMNVYIAEMIVKLLSVGKESPEYDVKVYRHQGTTVHNKFFVIDGTIGMIGSYNYHPKSMRYEAESTVLVTGEAAQQLSMSFKENIELSQEADAASTNREVRPQYPTPEAAKQAWYIRFIMDLFVEQI